jgi:hypothetical protein
MAIKWKFDDESHETRSGYDTDTNERVAVISKHGATYHMTLIDNTAKGTPSLYVGARATLSDAQDFLSLVNSAMRSIDVESKRRGSLSVLEYVVTAIDVADQAETLRETVTR